MSPIENIKGPIIMITGKDAQVWPSSALAREAAKCLHNKNFPFYFKHYDLPANHFVSLHKDYDQLVDDFLKQQVIGPSGICGKG